MWLHPWHREEKEQWKGYGGESIKIRSSWRLSRRQALERHASFKVSKTPLDLEHLLMALSSSPPPHSASSQGSSWQKEWTCSGFSRWDLAQLLGPLLRGCCLLVFSLHFDVKPICTERQFSVISMAPAKITMTQNWLPEAFGYSLRLVPQTSGNP